MTAPLRVLFAVAVLFAGALRAADARLQSNLSQIREIAEQGSLEAALRQIEIIGLQYPDAPEVAALRTEVERLIAEGKGRPTALPRAGRLPEIPVRHPEPVRNFTTETAGIAMLWVAPGTVVLRNPFGSDDDTTVTLSRGYWLGRTEVTQEQLQAVMEHLPPQSQFRGSDRPAERISWLSAMEFAARMTERERAAGRLPEGYVYLLPTEAQWEYACRAGSTGLFGGELEEVAWFAANSAGQTHPVGRRKPNAWGFHDMHGNVFEWCLDGFHSYPGGHVVDLFIGYDGPSAAMSRMVRGGAWNSTIGMSRAAYRVRYPVNYTGPGVGFRLALVPLRAAPPAGAAAMRP